MTQIPMTLSHRGIIIVEARGFKMRPQGLHEFARAPRLQELFLLNHPNFSGLRGARNGCCGGTHVIANMVEVHQVVALCAKFLLDLCGNPVRGLRSSAAIIPAKLTGSFALPN
jgi:hypothetical protein